MKLTTTLLAFVLGNGLTSAQGTFVYDQQSTGTVDGSGDLSQAPFGQSFTPTLDSIGFVDLQLFDSVSPVSLAVNIRSGSITGSILGTSQPTIMPGSSSGIFDFIFSNPIALTPGTQYFFEPIVIGTGGVGAEVTFIQYTGGDFIQSGVARTDRDLWFREGVISNVPEPTSAALLLVGGGAACWMRRKKRAT